MTFTSTLAVLSMLFISVATAQAADPSPKPSPSKNPSVLLKTSMGEITIELDQLQAPISVKNFLDYVDAKFYDGTIYHRVIPGFMIQGGGFTPNMQQKPTKAPIKNEAGNGLKNAAGTLAMARTGIVDSATPHGPCSSHSRSVIIGAAQRYATFPPDGRGRARAMTRGAP